MFQWWRGCCQRAMPVSNSGATMAEYAVIGGIVLSCSFFAFMGLGNSLKGQIDGFGQSLRPSDVHAIENQYKRMGNSSTKLAGIGQSDTDGQDGGATGDWPGMANNPKQAAMAIQTVGANGATKELAAMLHQYVMQMQANGELTEAEASSLLTLANQGHRLAQAQKLLEEAIVRGDTTVTHEGKTYSLFDFVNSIGFNIRGGPSILMNLPPENANSTLRPFAEQFQVVKQSGALNDPALEAKVSDLVYQIAFITDTLRWTGIDIMKSGDAAGQGEEALKQSMVEHYLMNLGDPSLSIEDVRAAMKTHGNSKRICNTGNGVDSGHHCGR